MLPLIRRTDCTGQVGMLGHLHWQAHAHGQVPAYHWRPRYPVPARQVQGARKQQTLATPMATAHCARVPMMNNHCVFFSLQPERWGFCSHAADTQWLRGTTVHSHMMRMLHSRTRARTHVHMALKPPSHLQHTGSFSNGATITLTCADLGQAIV